MPLQKGVVRMSKKTRANHWLRVVNKCWAWAYGRKSSLSPVTLPLRGIALFGKYLPHGSSESDWVNIFDVLNEPEKYPLYAKIISNSDPELPVLLRYHNMVPVDGIFRIARVIQDYRERNPNWRLDDLWFQEEVSVVFVFQETIDKYCPEGFQDDPRFHPTPAS